MSQTAPWRDPVLGRSIAAAIAREARSAWTLMEVCGGQTHAIVRHGLDRLLPPGLTLVHGPGCPVCVTPAGAIDAAIDLAGRPGVTLATFGDMLRVPGTATDLMAARAAGGDVRPVYGPLDAVALAEALPDRQVVFFAVGFETTAPANAIALKAARAKGLTNFSALVAHVLVPPAMEAILAAEDNRVQGFLAAGHVCTIMGLGAYHALAERHRVPIVVCGFEPVDILAAVLACVKMLERGEVGAINAYARAVQEEGNTAAQALMAEVFVVRDRPWRGLGSLPMSGLGLAPAFRDLDAQVRFGLSAPVAEEAGPCRAGEVLRGVLRPTECPAFGKDCTPDTPLGAPMVSEEGACAAYHRYRGHSIGGDHV